MATSLYMDVHIPQAITEQLRRRGVDVLTKNFLMVQAPGFIRGINPKSKI